jgi:hypothetical protein
MSGGDDDRRHGDEEVGREPGLQPMTEEERRRVEGLSTARRVEVDGRLVEVETVDGTRIYAMPPEGGWNKEEVGR